MKLPRVRYEQIASRKTQKTNEINTNALYLSEIETLTAQQEEDIEALALATTDESGAAAALSESSATLTPRVCGLKARVTGWKSLSSS